MQSYSYLTLLALVAIAFAGQAEDMITADLTQWGITYTTDMYAHPHSPSLLDTPATSKPPKTASCKHPSSSIPSQFHYMFYPAPENAAQKPVMLWLNGGPGCSSLEGTFAENGPFIFEDGKENFVINPYPFTDFVPSFPLSSPLGQHPLPRITRWGRLLLWTHHQHQRRRHRSEEPQRRGVLLQEVPRVPGPRILHRRRKLRGSKYPPHSYSQ